MRLIFAVLLGGYALSASVVSAQGQEVAIKSNASSPMAAGTLPNGFRFLLENDATSRGYVTFRLVVHSGSLDEDSDQADVAHLIEHVGALQGGRREILERAGLKMGASFGGSTTSLYTDYHIIVPTGRVDLYAIALSALHDVASNMTINEEFVGPERGAVISEHELSETPELSRDYFLRRYLYASDCLSHDNREFIKANIRSVPISTVQRYYDDWYSSDNETLFVSGDFDISLVKAQFVEKFGTLRPTRHRPRAAIALRCKAHLPGVTRGLVLPAPGSGASSISLNIKRPFDLSAPVAERVHAELLNKLVNLVVQDRLSNMMDRYNNPYRGISVENEAKTPLAFGLRIFAISQSFEEVSDWRSRLMLIVNALSYLRKSPISLGELQAAKDELQRSWTSKCGFIDLEDRQEEPVCIDAADLKRRLQPITSKVLGEALRADTRLDRDVDVVLLTRDGEEAVPSREELTGALLKASRLSASPNFPSRLTPRTLMSQAVINSLSPPPPSEQRERGPSGVISLRLANGITVLIHNEPNGPLASQVRITALRPGGLRHYAKSDQPSARGAGAIAENGGTGAFDKFALRDWDERHDTSITYGISDGGAHISASAPVRELEQLLQRIYLVQTESRWNREAFTDWMATNYPRGFSAEGPGSAESDVVLDKARRIFQDRFSKAGDFVYIVTGGFDTRHAISLLNRYLGSLSAARSDISMDQTSERAAVPLSNQNGFDGTVQFVRGGNGSLAEVSVEIRAPLPIGLKERVPFELLGAAVKSRMFDRIRGKEAAAYDVITGVSRQGAVNGVETFVLTVVFKCSPDRAEQMLSAAIDEFERLRRDGFDSDLLAKAKASLSNGKNLRLAETSWHDYLIKYYNEKSLAFDPNYREEVLPFMDISMMNDIAKRVLRQDMARKIIRTP